MKYFRSSAFIVLLATTGVVWCGCGRDVRLAGQKIRHVKVGPVDHYGIKLDQAATPEQVAFVALRAIREDFFAATKEERERATDVQFDVAAVEVISNRNRSSLSRDEYIHHVVTHWTPAVSHYSGDFEVEFEKAAVRFKNRGNSKPSGAEVAECELAMEIADPGKDPAASVVMLIWLAKDGGFWRVIHFGFEPKRTLASAKPIGG